MFVKTKIKAKLRVDKDKITPEILLGAYANGYFPMAETADSNEIYWFYPKLRGQLSIENFHISKSLKRFIKKDLFTVKVNSCFEEVILGCADRDTTWINQIIIDWFLELHYLGFAHSVEVFYKDKNDLVGGVYGIALGGAFFAESMFSRASNTSKIALTYLMAHLWKQGFQLFDTQYINEHIKQFGCYEIKADIYKQKLEKAINMQVSFYSDDILSELGGVSSSSFELPFSLVLDFLEFLQSMSQTSKIG